METIHPQASNGKRPGINDRRSHQCARRGWRGRKVSPQQLAQFIAESIQARIEEGRAWSWAEYGIDDEPHKIAMVLSHLPTKTPAEIETLKQQWLNDPCFLIEDAQGYEAHRQELLEFRLTHTAWATGQAKSSPALVACWEWRVAEDAAPMIEAKQVIAHYLGWMGVPIGHNPEQVDALAQALVDAAVQQEGVPA